MKPFSLLMKIIAAAAIAAAAGVIVFLAYTLKLRTDYREMALEVNDAALAYLDGARISRGDISLDATKEAVDYYNRFLLDAYTMVYSRKGIPETGKTIVLELGENKLSFTGVEDGTSVGLCWDSGGERKLFRVRCQITFNQLEAYFMNYKKKAGS